MLSLYVTAITPHLAHHIRFHIPLSLSTAPSVSFFLTHKHTHTHTTQGCSPFPQYLSPPTGLLFIFMLALCTPIFFFFSPFLSILCRQRLGLVLWPRIPHYLPLSNFPYLHPSIHPSIHPSVRSFSPHAALFLRSIASFCPTATTTGSRFTIKGQSITLGLCLQVPQQGECHLTYFLLITWRRQRAKGLGDWFIMQLLLASREKVRSPYGEHFKRPLVTDEPVMFVSHTCTSTLSLFLRRFLCSSALRSLSVTHTHSNSRGIGNWAPPSCCQVWVWVSPHVQQQTLK